MITKIKCLSVMQPWAGLIVAGVKDVENRTWRSFYRGDLLIHASKKADEWAAYHLDQILADHDATLVNRSLCQAKGGIIGVARLVDVNRKQSSAWHEDDSWGWYFSEAQHLPYTLPYKGELGLFDVPFELLRGFLFGLGREWRVLEEDNFSGRRKGPNQKREVIFKQR